MISIEKLSVWTQSLSSDDKEKLLNDIDKAVSIIGSVFGSIDVDVDVLKILLSEKDQAFKTKAIIEERKKEIANEINRLKAEDEALSNQLDAIIILNKQVQNTFSNDMDIYKKALLARLETKRKAKEELKDSVLNNKKMTVEEMQTLVELSKPSENPKPKKTKVVKAEV